MYRISYMTEFERRPRRLWVSTELTAPDVGTGLRSVGWESGSTASHLGRAGAPAGPDAGLIAEVRPQVERILSLDVDGSGFPEVGG